MNINEINVKLERIIGKKIPNQRTIAKYLKEILQENEEIVAYATGVYDGKRMNLLTTNKRVIIFNKGLIRVTQVEIPIEKINSIGKYKGLISGKIHIWDSSSKIEINNVPKKQIEPFVNATNQQINNYKSFKIEVNNITEKDIADKIDKLAELHKEGVLTDYEFTMKKMELLEKIQK